MYYLISLIFFFYCYSNLRDLHSFPTRRSSDLLPFQRAHWFAVDFAPGRPDRHEQNFPAQICRDGPAGRAHPLRSEEHTSELQSRVDLVCRLLLEKKKQNKNNIK